MAAIEEEKVAAAEARFAEAANDACRRVLELLGDDTIKLWRPVGHGDRELIRESGMRKSPPLLPD